MTRPVLVLSRREVAALLPLDACITAVEGAFRAYAHGRMPPPGVLGLPVEGGGFHIKAAATSEGSRRYFATKINGNFPDNRERHGLPTIQGVIALCDGSDGSPLALMDSIEITTLRTGAATAVAAKYLARPGGAVVTICGCGKQGRVQLRALSRVLSVTQVYACDSVPERASGFAKQMGAELELPVKPVEDLQAAARETGIWVTCTTARRAFLGKEHVAPGAFVAAVGADNEDKQELSPELLAGSAVVVDVLEQCAVIGDLHHALEAKLMTQQDVRAELGQVVAGLRPGRRSDDEIVVFDSTGTALQDVAAAVMVYEEALVQGVGLRVPLGD